MSFCDQFNASDDLNLDGAAARRGHRRGLSLLELVVVVAILAILAGAIIPLVSHTAVQARDTAARASLTSIRDAIVGRAESAGFRGDTGRLPYSVAELLTNSLPAGLLPFDRDANRGWRGPYVISHGASYSVSGTFTNRFGNNGDPAIADPWGNPIILQSITVASGNVIFTDQTGFSQSVATVSGILDGDYTRIISAGPNGQIETSVTDPTAAGRGDDIVLFLSYADTHS